MRLSEIAKFVSGNLSGDSETTITGVAKIEEAGEGEITFLAHPRYRKYLLTTAASAVLIGRDADIDQTSLRAKSLAMIRVDDPYKSFLSLVDLFYPPPARTLPGIHRTSVLASSARIDPTAFIGPCVVVGERASVGAGTVLHAGTIIEDDVLIGNNCILYANVVVRERCRVGSRVVIHPGTVLGSDGFGFTQNADGSYDKIPQRGIVVIEDDVEIGANCTIDRATIGETLIKRGAKLDNLIQIAHNVVIGEHTAIAAQAGISGSTKVGDYCQIAGQAGLTGHIQIADHTTIGAQSGVPKSIKEPGKVYMGYPAREIRQTWKIEAMLEQLPDLLQRLRTLEERLAKLEERLQSTK
ncbi:MAG TPA: UDP-3-O-(3-hydroxymyristoyl)glucosamine N-acyltransferase [Bacteroidota bacterium]|nr:UDP-3-O-(3-hydroxymyristoyl)glucosamine N-acyltransferase [Bacteroidota bacterium]